MRRALQSYLDGVLDDATAERVARHLPACQRCGQETKTYRAIKNSLARRGSYPPTTVARLREFGQAMQEQLDEPPGDA
ncbi:MAG: anti-sigma factor family protein [Pseudonocardiaceae bacterium]